jgi:hypothetical protein
MDQGRENRQRAANQERTKTIEAAESDSAEEKAARDAGNDQLKRQAAARAKILSPQNRAASKSRDQVGMDKARKTAQERFKGTKVDGGVRRGNDYIAPAQNEMTPTNDSARMEKTVDDNDWTKDIAPLPAAQPKPQKKKGLFSRLFG